ncbi:MAG: shikimate dehydrogenase [Chitinophagaceae bacterium]|nr:shikimate dehydrogenase [Chitinophagaceae bacterium]
MRLFGLIGYPLSHSFSKKYFSEKFEKDGLVDCRYELFPIKSIHELPQLLRDNPGLEGLNVTIPYKKQVLPFLNSSEIPSGLEACNCISIKNGNLVGYNTDAIGFEKSLLPYLRPYHTDALILGSGGATEAIVYVLKRLGIKYSVVSRKMKTGSAFIYEELNEDIINQHKLIINTTPLGMYPATNICPAIPYDHISSQHLLFDLTYNPAKTLFLQKGEERGATIINGQEMLLIQAEESWNIWNKNSTM